MGPASESSEAKGHWLLRMRCCLTLSWDTHLSPEITWLSGNTLQKMQNRLGRLTLKSNLKLWPLRNTISLWCKHKRCRKYWSHQNQIRIRLTEIDKFLTEHTSIIHKQTKQQFKTWKSYKWVRPPTISTSSVLLWINEWVFRGRGLGL